MGFLSQLEPQMKLTLEIKEHQRIANTKALDNTVVPPSDTKTQFTHIIKKGGPPLQHGISNLPTLHSPWSLLLVILSTNLLNVPPTTTPGFFLSNLRLLSLSGSSSQMLTVSRAQIHMFLNKRIWKLPYKHNFMYSRYVYIPGVQNVH